MEFKYNDNEYTVQVEDLINPVKYSLNVLSRIFTYCDECCICYVDFKDPELGPTYYLDCSCVIGYHHKCIQTALEYRNRCPQCRKPNPKIVFFKGNIQDIKVYEDFYDKVITFLVSSSDRLQFIHNWCTPMKNKANMLNRSCLVNPFNYLDYTVYTPNYEECLLFTDLVINPIDQTSFQPNEQTIRPEKKFWEEWSSVTQGIFAHESWTWDNVVVAGGMPSKVLCAATKYYPETSDFDLFVYGTDRRQREDSLRRIIKFFSEYYKAWFVIKNAIIEILIKDFPRSFQLICGNYSTVDEILLGFDLSHIQVVVVDSNKVLCTPEFIMTMKYQITKIDDSKFRVKRVLKLVGTGLSLASKNDVGDLPLITRDKQHHKYSPSWETPAELCRAYEVDQNHVTQDPNKCIHLAQTDQSIRTNSNYEDQTFVLDLRRFTNFEGLHIKQTGKNGFYLFKLSYPQIPQLFLEVNNVKLKKIIDTTSNHSQGVSVDCVILSQESNDLLKEFVNKIINLMKQYANHKPWIKMTRVFPTINNIKINSRTRIFENNVRVDRDNFVENIKGHVVDAIIVLNGIRCGFQAKNGMLDLHFHEIRYFTQNAFQPKQSTSGNNCTTF